MGQKHPSQAPRRRWWQRRLIFFAALIALFVGGYWRDDWLFMPADLRRMQGSWRLVRLNDIVDPGVEAEIGKVLKIESRAVRLHFQPEDPMLIELNGNRFILYDLADTERTFLGCKVRVPAWLKRPTAYVHGVFQCDDRHLMIWIKGEINEAAVPVVREEDRAEKWYLERD